MQVLSSVPSSKATTPESRGVCGALHAGNPCLDFSAAVNLPRLSPVGRWEMEDAKKLILLSLSPAKKRASWDLERVSWRELSQSEGGRDESEEGKERLGLATLLH